MKVLIDRALLERVLAVFAAIPENIEGYMPDGTDVVVCDLREALQAKPVKFTQFGNSEDVRKAKPVERKQMKCIYCDEPTNFDHTCPISRKPAFTFIDPVAEMDKTSANLDTFQHVHFSDPGKGLCITSSDMVKWLITNRSGDYFKRNDDIEGHPV
jgi:hypothetical protein